jgi:hypothetical protein
MRRLRQMPDTPVTQPDLFVGWWEVDSYISDGVPTDVSGIIEHVDGAGNFAVFRDGERIGAGYHTDFTVDPDGFTNVSEAPGPGGQFGRELAIYRVKENVLEVCKASEQMGRPSRFDSPRGSGWTHVVIRRLSDDDPRIADLADARPARSEQFSFVTLKSVASLDDFGTYADSVFALTRATFGHAESVDETLRHLSGDDVALVTDGRTGGVVGLTTLSMSTGAQLPHVQLERHGEVSRETAIAYLQGTVIHPDAQGRGLYRKLNRLRFEGILDRRARFVSTTTQNPKVERGIRSILDDLIEERRIVGWTLDTEVLPGCYGQLLAADQPDTAGTPFEHLDREAGDACSLLFDLRYQSDV